VLKTPRNLQHDNPPSVRVDINDRFDPSMKPHTLPLDAELALAIQTMDNKDAKSFARALTQFLVDPLLGSDDLDEQIQSGYLICHSNRLNI
jgi:transformation/transcription domain-associated protein